MKHFRGRTAAITGAASGIGRALALALAAEGCNVALCDVDEQGLEEVRAEAERCGVEASAQRVDVSSREQLTAWADAAVERHGAVQLVINNAGVALVASVKNMTLEEFEWLMGINFWGVVHGTQAFLPHLERAGEGHVVNISSVFGLIGFPAHSAYNAAKFGVRGFTEALSIELALEGSKVRATVVHPGGVRTRIARSGRIGVNESSTLSPDEQDAEFQAVARTTSEQAARGILDGVRRNKRRILVGRGAHGIALMQRLFPVLYQRAVTLSVRRRQPGQV